MTYLQPDITILNVLTIGRSP
jgi:sirohydrochlorin ferrochelatase